MLDGIRGKGRKLPPNGGNGHNMNESFKLPQPPKEKLWVTLPKTMSRLTYMNDTDANTLPQFASASFLKDLERLFLESKSLQELAVSARQINNHYLWPCTSFSILYIKPKTDKMTLIDIPQGDLKAIGPNDMGGVYDHVVKSGRALYMPDTEFRKAAFMEQFPEGASELISKAGPFSLDIIKELPDTSAMKKNVFPHSKSMFVMPLFVRGKLIGLMSIGFRRRFEFSDDLEPGALEKNNLRWMFRLGESVALCLDKLLP